MFPSEDRFALPLVGIKNEQKSHTFHCKNHFLYLNFFAVFPLLLENQLSNDNFASQFHWKLPSLFLVDLSLHEWIFAIGLICTRESKTLLNFLKLVKYFVQSQTHFVCRTSVDMEFPKVVVVTSVARKFKSICRKLALFEFALPSWTCKLASWTCLKNDFFYFSLCIR